MEAKKIYIVTSGCYSDYHIDAVFTTQDKANGYVQQHGICYEIEEYDVDEEVIRQVQVWRIEFNIDTKELSDAGICYKKADEYRDTCRVTRYLRGGGSLICFFVDADSMDKAIKIASERFAAIKSNDYIWSRLTTSYTTNRFGLPQFERFNTKTNEFTKD